LALPERVTLLKNSSENPAARYVLYWMQVYKRTTRNEALNFAVHLANERRLPLVVYEGLRFDYPWANDRIHTFILEGVAEKKRAFEQLGIHYLFYLQRNRQDLDNVLMELAAEAAAIVTDDFPCFIVPHHNAIIAERARIQVYKVDSNGIIPTARFDHEEYAAYTIRPKIKKLLPLYIDPPRDADVDVKANGLRLNVRETEVSPERISRLVSECDIDHSVGPSPIYHGGEGNARRRLSHFVEHILPRYDGTRNEPSVDGTSRLSSYLHFGYVSAHEIVAAVRESDAPEAAKESFLEELIVRRELSFNFTKFNPDYDSLFSAPEWAKKTMRDHLHDERPAIIDKDRIGAGETYDEVWNACQKELLYTGELHNYVRMLWGKLVIQWRRSYEESFTLLEHLNNKYALDGRDPNSYAGIMWCFGKHDRAWGPARPVFGTLRYMTSASMARKIKFRAYENWVNQFAP
jgi:deoxyribodipyrimidine photo-lyase